MEVTGCRGSVKAPAKIGGFCKGICSSRFIMDTGTKKAGSGPNGTSRAANEIRLPLGPRQQAASVQVRGGAIDKVASKSVVSRVTDAVEQSVDKAKELAATALARRIPKRAAFIITWP